MAKFVCSVCGYVHEDLTAPENCPVCMAPASKFSEIEEVSSIENEPTEDNVEEDVEEIIETEVDKTAQSEKPVGSHSEKEPQALTESDDHIESIGDNINLQNINSDAAVSVANRNDADEEAILKKFQENPAAVLVLVKWYVDTYHVSVKEARDRVYFVLDKHGLRKAKSGSGCMVTILIAITSTLSSFFLL